MAPSARAAAASLLGVVAVSMLLWRRRRSRKRVIGVYGGALNPITYGHLQLATEIVHSGHVDEVWLCPCGPRPDKPKMKTSPEHRTAMCEIAINSAVSLDFPIRVTDHEAIRGPMATYDSLCYLRERHPDCDFCFVIGSDWLQPGTDIREWTSKEGRTGERLLNEFDFLVLPRPGYEVADLTAFGPRMRWMRLPDGLKLVGSNASSTELRKRARAASTSRRGRHPWRQCQGGGVDGTLGPSLRAMDGLLPPAVLAYIGRHEMHKQLAADFDSLRETESKLLQDTRTRASSSGYHPTLVTGI